MADYFFKKAVLFIMMSEDSSSEHSVCLFNKMIFDSNRKRALKFSIENLTKCCSGVEFRSVMKAYSVEEKDNSWKKKNK